MNRFLNLTTLATGIWWSTILLTWTQISDPHSSGARFELAGSELSQTLVLTPAIVLLTSLIARYRKISNLVMLFAATVAVWSSYLAFNLNPAASPAAIDGLEKLTGVAGSVGLATDTAAPISYVALGVIVAILSILSARSKQKSQTSSSEQSEADLSDPKSLWDAQS